jgi:hypothetical protein
MGFIGILAALALLTAIFGTYRATKNAGSTSDSRSWDRSRRNTPRLHFVRQEQTIGPHGGNPHHIVFELQDSQSSGEEVKNSPKMHGISMNELEKCIPWVPLDNTIFIGCSGGFSPSAINHLKNLDTTRDLYLIDPCISQASSKELVEA